MDTLEEFMDILLGLVYIIVEILDNLDNRFIRISLGIYINICIFRCLRNDVIYTFYNLVISKFQKIPKMGNKNLIQFSQYQNQSTAPVFPLYNAVVKV